MVPDFQGVPAEPALPVTAVETVGDALSRLETMVSMANLNLTDNVVRRQIASAINIVVQISRLNDGTRRVTNISEVTGMEGPIVTMQELFFFQRLGRAENRKILGEFRSKGIRSKFVERLDASGVSIPLGIFRPARLEQFLEE